MGEAHAQVGKSDPGQGTASAETQGGRTWRDRAAGDCSAASRGQPVGAVATQLSTGSGAMTAERCRERRKRWDEACGQGPGLWQERPAFPRGGPGGSHCGARRSPASFQPQGAEPPPGHRPRPLLLTTELPAGTFLRPTPFPTPPPPMLVQVAALGGGGLEERPSRVSLHDPASRSGFTCSAPRGSARGTGGSPQLPQGSLWPPCGGESQQHCGQSPPTPAAPVSWAPSRSARHPTGWGWEDVLSHPHPHPPHSERKRSPGLDPQGHLPPPPCSLCSS